MKIVKVEGKYMNTNIYDETFFESQAERSYRSAQTVIDILFKKIGKINSVIDIGCGVGTWLKVFQEKGVDIIKGKDGNNLNENLLYIPRKNIVIEDLDYIQQNTDKKFDLAISLEVAEHLKPESSKKFIKSLSSYSDLIMFSAAIDDQQSHIHTNIRPLQYWVDLFNNEGYECFDIIRPSLIEEDNNVDPWYIQNILLFAANKKKDYLYSQGFKPRKNVIQFYHPSLLAGYIKQIKYMQTLKYKFYKHFLCPISKIIKFKTFQKIIANLKYVK